MSMADQLFEDLCPHHAEEPNFSFTNIFGHSFVSNLFVQIYSDIHS